MTSSKFKLSSLTCEACVRLSKMRIGKIEGVKDVEIDIQGNLEIKADRQISKEEVSKSLAGTEYAIN